MQHICLGNKGTKVLFKLIAFTQHGNYNLMQPYEANLTETATDEKNLVVKNVEDNWLK